MAGRALVFSNSGVMRLIKAGFVPYAGDQWYLHRQQDAAGKFFWKVVQQGHYQQRPVDNTRQGIYAATPDGELLGSINSWSAEKTVAMLQQAAERWKGRPNVEANAGSGSAADAQFARQPPEGGLILNVYARIPLAAAAGQEWGPNQATGRDHMWLTREEWGSLLPDKWQAGARYPVSPAVAERLLRFHLVDNIRGEPPMWTRGDIGQEDLTLEVEDVAAGRLRLRGTARMHATQNGWGGERGYDARIQGIVTVDRGRDRIRRFDLLSWGHAWGQGRYTGGAPAGRFPLVIAFSLAGDRPADRVPPQGSRNRDEYFGTRQAAR